jgi:hypothetical protein
VRTLAGDGKAYMEGRRLASRMEKWGPRSERESIYDVLR